MGNLYTKLQRIHEVMIDPEISSIRLVMNPERMVIREAYRAHSYLQLYGYPVDAVIMNRILPVNDSSIAFGEYSKNQERYLQEIEETFAFMLKFTVPHLGREVFGIAL